MIKLTGRKNAPMCFENCQKEVLDMLTRRDPFREMIALQRSLDRLMENALGNSDWSTTEWGVALDVIEEEDDFIVKASVPGVDPEDLEITFNNGILTIRGEVKDERETHKGEYQLRERRYGSFSRSINLPTSIKSDDISATYENGVLKLTLPKTEEVKPRRIPVRIGKNRVIEGK